MTDFIGHGRRRGGDRAVVYFAATVLSGGGVLVKIGSTSSLANRLGHIQRHERITRRQRPIVVHLEVGSYERERERHAQFAAYRVDREWFTSDVLRDPSVMHLGDPHEYVAAHPEISICAAGWAGHRITATPKPPLASSTQDGEGLADDVEAELLADMKAAVAIIEEKESLLAQARHLRDGAIKEWWAHPVRPAIAEIAEAAGVSVATVKAVLR